MAVSPGGTSSLALIGDACPTFSWGEVEGAKSYELVIYRLGEEGEEAQPVLRQSFAGSVDSWTPSLDLCLESGGRYAWSVRALGKKLSSDWSPPSLFEVAAGPSAAEFEEALEVIRQYVTVRGEAGEAPSQSRSAPTVRGEDSVAVSALRAPATQLSVEGGIEAALFIGDGSGLTKIGSASIANNSLTAADVDSTSIQERVSGTCPFGQSIRVIDTGGSVSCEPDTDSNAGTFCPNGTFLNGDGTCDFVSGVTEEISNVTLHIMDNNGGGDVTNVLIIGSSSNRFCALSTVSVENTDTNGETATCVVRILGGSWRLEATLGKPNRDARVFCAAHCFQLG